VSVAFAAAPVAPGSRVVLPLDAARAVVSWNSRTEEGHVWVRAIGRSGAAGERLRLAQWSTDERRSFSEHDALVAIDVDVVRALEPLAALEIETSAPLELLALASDGPTLPPRAASGRAFELDVPARSQYPAAAAHPQLPAGDAHSHHPAGTTRSQFPAGTGSLSPGLAASARGWCSPASLAMILEYCGRDLPLEEVARSVYDSAYGGTGNWSFNVAFAGSLGLRAHAAFLRDLREAEDLLESGSPPALSFDWHAGELPGAPLAESAGHFAVLRGFNAQGDPLLNDPAQPGVRTSYPRAAFEAVWLRHGGLAYVVAVPNTDVDESASLVQQLPAPSDPIVSRKPLA
jgi:hypothetical protein